MNRSRVLLIDDHPIVIQGLTQLIEQEDDLEICGEANDAVGAMKAVESLHPDIAVIDLSLPGVEGLELIKGIRSRFPNIPLLVLSMHDENIYASRALRAGAKGYVMKDQGAKYLIEGIRKVSSGEVFVSPSVAAKIMQDYSSSPKGPKSSTIDQLTDRELEVFRNIGKGRSTRQIAENLCLSVKTIETYRAKIKSKLQLSNSTEVVQRAVHWMQTNGEI